MPAESVRRDLHVGFRMLLKEKAFCALAIVVLTLGIGGVTTMFSVVNGVMLRGFAFPNAHRLVSVNFIDPSSSTFFGTNGQVSSMDFEELPPSRATLFLAGVRAGLGRKDAFDLLLGRAPGRSGSHLL